jgi:hypothetical protein
MTRINYTELNQLTRLDEIIAYSIITLQEAYTAPNNDDLDSVTKNDVSDWVRWEIAYDDQGRAFFRYAASLYVVDKSPLADADFLSLINSPTKWLVTHASVGVDPRVADTSLAIDPLVDIPVEANTMEKLLFWAIVLGDWWNLTLRWLTSNDFVTTPPATPIGNWGAIEVSIGAIVDPLSAASTIDAQFDAYNGTVKDPSIPDFLTTVLDKKSDGTGTVDQTINLPASDSGNYRENLTTCEEQDPAIKTFSLQQLEILLPSK